MAIDVFISYPSENKLTADAICSKLESKEIRCWIAPRDVLPGSQYAESLYDAIDSCKVFILVFSDYTNNSSHIMSEVQRAFNKSKIIIPFRIQDVAPSTTLEYFIANTHWLDGLTLPLDQKIEELAEVVKNNINASDKNPKPQNNIRKSFKKTPDPFKKGIKNNLKKYVLVTAVVMLLVFAVSMVFSGAGNSTNQINLDKNSNPSTIGHMESTPAEGLTNNMLESVIPKISKIYDPFKFVSAWGLEGSGNGEFNQPTGLALSPSGEVYVCDRSNDRIQIFSMSGEFLNVIGERGSDPGKFSSPRSLCFDASGNFYVADTGNNRIQKFSSSGQLITVWGHYGNGDGEFNSPSDLKVSQSGDIIIVDYGNDRILKYSPDGQFIEKWGVGNDKFNAPISIDSDNNGNWYVLDEGASQKIQKFSSDGKYISKFGESGDANGELYYPAFLRVDSNGNLMITDKGNNRVQILTSTGDYLYSWGFKGTGEGQFVEPFGILIDSRENSVYISDYGNDRIQKFVQ